MKIGLIILFYNSEKEIDNTLFNDLFTTLSDVKLCLVNNGSKDATLEKLITFKESNNLSVSIVDVKRNKGIEAAIKAGARYLSNQNKLKYIGYINWEKSQRFKSLNELINFVEYNKELVIKYNTKVEKHNKFKRTLFKNIFSINQWLPEYLPQFVF